MSSHHVVGIGNALVDIEIRVEEDFIRELDLTKGGMTLTTPEDQAKVLASVAGHAQKIVSGGSATLTEKIIRNRKESFAMRPRVF